MRTILIQPDVIGADKFREILSAKLTDFHIALSIEEVEFFDVEIVIMWLNVPSFLAELPNLKLLLTCGSGVDHIITSPNLPRNIPLIRLVDPFLQDHVSDYVVEQIFEHFFPGINYKSQERATRRFFESAKRKKPRVGLMGLGLVGSATAQKLVDMNFEVSGWVKSTGTRPIKAVYIGKEALKDFAKESEVLVCQLPLTAETQGVLNIDLFTLLPTGAFLINVGRGAHLIESDLLVALETGKLSGACLDVFEVEPVPMDHPFNANPRIKMTPHIAGYISPETQAPYAAQMISNFYKKQKIKGVVDYFSLY